MHEPNRATDDPADRRREALGGGHVHPRRPPRPLRAGAEGLAGERRRPRARPVLPVQGARADGLLRGPGGAGLLPGVVARRLGLLRQSRSASTPTATWCPGWRSGPARSVTGCRWRWARRWACAPRASSSRVVVLVGDAELDEGSNHEAHRAGRRLLPGRAHRRRDRQPLVVSTPSPAGSSSASPPRAGTRSPSTAATTTCSRRRCRTASSAAQRRRRHRGGEVLIGRTGTASSPGPPPTSSTTDRSAALVYAEISGQYFGDVAREHPDRVINVGIREQLLVSVGAGLALSGMRPIVHTFGSFLVERAFEQVKLGLRPPGRRRGAGRFRRLLRHLRRPAAPTSPPATWRCSTRCPASPSTCPATRPRSTRRSARHRRRGRAPLRPRGRPGQRAPCTRAPPGRFHVVRRGSGRDGGRGRPGAGRGRSTPPRDRDVTVLYANTVRPFDPSRAARRARHAGGHPGRAVAGRHVARARLRGAAGRPHRLLSLGVRRRRAPSLR